jgi:uncharacterized protein YcfJ
MRRRRQRIHLAAMPRLPIPLTMCLLALAAAPAMAQNTVIQTENVRTEYAQVLRAEPVYQTLRATNMVQRCEPSEPVQASAVPGQRRGLSRVVGAVKGALGQGLDTEPAAPPASTPRDGDDCRMVPVEREFRRPIAYDVDYVHKGVKYRSRLPYDPGNRVRVRVSVTPIVPPAGDR